MLEICVDIVLLLLFCLFDAMWYRKSKALSLFGSQVKLQNEMNLRLKAESSAASAEEKASVLGRKRIQLSESIEKEKKRLNNEIELLKRESKLSVSRIRADVSRYIYGSKFS
jgi:hypothetical protein